LAARTRARTTYYRLQRHVLRGTITNEAFADPFPDLSCALLLQIANYRVLRDSARCSRYIASRRSQDRVGNLPICATRQPLLGILVLTLELRISSRVVLGTHRLFQFVSLFRPIGHVLTHLARGFRRDREPRLNLLLVENRLQRIQRV